LVQSFTREPHNRDCDLLVDVGSTERHFPCCGNQEQSFHGRYTAQNKTAKIKYGEALFDEIPTPKNIRSFSTQKNLEDLLVQF